MKHETLSNIHFANESAEYRTARNALLAEEIKLRQQTERVAAQRRALPSGGAISEDYQFEREGGSVKLSELFAPDMSTLAIYSFMYGSERELPCMGCTHFLDGLEGMAQHINHRINLAIVAKSPISRILTLAKKRGWHNLHLLSTAGNNYDRDYFGDTSALPVDIGKEQGLKDGEVWDMPMLNVFRRDGEVIYHFWGSELLYMPPESGQEYRHNDALDSLWNMLDLTPEGRGDFHPQLSYA
jgi:predicted dithiol-disulfide oxidoreductase (DUF899 family)